MLGERASARARGSGGQDPRSTVAHCPSPATAPPFEEPAHLSGLFSFVQRLFRERDSAESLSVYCRNNRKSVFMGARKNGYADAELR